MSPAPDRVIVASDEPLDTEFEVVLCQTKRLGPMRNAALEIADTEWFVPSDLDDLPLPNYVRNLGQDAEIHAYTLQMGIGLHGFRPQDWENAFDVNAGNPMVSCSAYKTDWGRRIRYRDVGWEDWAFWLDMKKAGARVYADPSPKYIYTHPPGSLSQQDVRQKELEIRQMKMRGVW